MNISIFSIFLKFLNELLFKIYIEEYTNNISEELTETSPLNISESENELLIV